MSCFEKIKDKIKNLYSYVKNIIKENFRKISLIVFFIYTIIYIAEYIHINKVLHFLDYSYLSIFFLFFYFLNLLNICSIIKYIIVFFLILGITAILKDFNLIEYWNFFIKEMSDYKVILIYFLFILNIILKFSSLRHKEKEETEETYSERKDDVDYIVDFIQNDQNKNIFTLGIDSNYGTGKTFVVEKALDKLSSNKYEIIKIRCLLLEKEEVYYYIIEEIKKILAKNLIFISNFKKFHKSILKIFDSKFLGGVSDFFSYNSVTDDIDNLKATIKKLNKNIIIVFDDIDRTNDIEKIEKILSFISDFSSENIKSIVLFSSDNLKKLDEKFDRDYLEKYIPLIREITEISFIKLLEEEIKIKKKELNKIKLNEEDFKFLCIFEKEYFLVYPNDSEKEKKEFKFINDLNYLLNISDIRIGNKQITPRQVKNFMEEIIGLFNYQNLNKNIERRVIIAYVFLKYIFYDEFYKKLDNETSFYDLFPIEIEFQDGIILNLDEIDLMQNLINKKDNILKELNGRDYIIINNKAFYFYKRNTNYNYEYTLVDYLKKLNYIASYESLEEKEEKFEKLEELFKGLKVKKLSEKSKINIFIYSLFNFYLYSYYEKKEYFVKERMEKIENAIRKLKFLGSEKQVSEYQKFYEDFSLEIYNKKLPEIFYEKFIDREKYEIFNVVGKYFTVLAMESLTIFGKKEEQKAFLNVILEMNKGNIKDDYLEAFFLTELDDIKISDNIVEKILKGDYRIDRESTIRLICKNLGRILKRFPFPEYKIINNLGEFLDSSKHFLIDYKTELYSSEILDYKEVNNILENYIKFIEKIKEISNSKKLINEDNNIRVSFKDREPEDTDEEKEIKNLNSEEEKIKKLIEFLINGRVKFKEANGIYFAIKNNKM
ncbi:P-loop NTPase fold protein [Fusobacterium animalis]|uniref:P-loop NTPase fold protein n=1 Tax=Fusobacterium animalis TaxID=76859 RepID=UPI0030CFF7E7